LPNDRSRSAELALPQSIAQHSHGMSAENSIVFRRDKAAQQWPYAEGDVVVARNQQGATRERFFLSMNGGGQFRPRGKGKEVRKRLITVTQSLEDGIRESVASPISSSMI